MDDDHYVLVMDKELGFCRLFRSDSEDIPAGEILWSGNGLRNGYDNMIRINKANRPVHSYSVCSSVSDSGRQVFRIVRDTPNKNLTVHDVFYEFARAREKLSELAAARDKAEAAERERMLAIMRRVGIPGKRIPRFTSSDLRYIEWMRETGKLAA